MTAKKKLLIISSYKRPCGIAQYVEHLETPLRGIDKWSVDVESLPVELFKFGSGFARKASQKYLADLEKKVKNYDVVNIQLEVGLFGKTQMSSWRRLKRIIDASSKILFTYHTVPNFMKKNEPFSVRPKQFKKWLHGELFGEKFFSKLFNVVKDNPEKFSHLVHTKREEKIFSMMGIPARTIHNFPLAFLSREMKEKYRSSNTREALLGNLNLQDDNELVLLGCFGFLSPYKGVEVAIRSMEYLSENYQLLVVGGLHPEGIQYDTTNQPYIDKLMRLLTTEYSLGKRQEFHKKRELLSKRIHFIGAPDNDKFNQIMSSCDAVILPYAEVGQTSSGPAALALDLQKPVYCSNNKAFKELGKYSSGALSYSEIGNYLELAQKIKNEDGLLPERVEARLLYGQEINIERRAQLYVELSDRLTS